MSEVIINKWKSICFGLLLLLLATYCVQFAVLKIHLEFVPIYYLGFLMLLLLVTVNALEDVEFSGLNLIPPRPYIAVIFWAAVLFICVIYFMNRGFWVDDPSRKSRIAHLLVGLYLYAFGASAILGSYFSGLGLRLFLKNPIVWLKYITMKSRGELNDDKSS